MKILHVSIGDMADKWDELSTEQEGACWRMVRKMASYNGSLPADERKAANRLHWDVRYYRRLRGWVLAAEQQHLGFYAGQDGGLRHLRVDRDFQDFNDARARASAAGKKGAEKRWGTTSGGTSTQKSHQKSHQKSTNIVHAKSLKDNGAAIATPSPTPSPSTRKKESPQTPKGACPDPFGFGNEARNEQASGIVVGKGGQIVLDPPVREQWAQMLGGETALDLALTEIGAEIAASAPRSPSLHVTRRLARMAKDKLDRDSRYAKAAANNAAAKAPAAFASKPTRWWEDPKQVSAKAPTLDAWRSLVTKHANGDWPIYYLGPPPGARGCVVPKEIVEEFELAGRYDEKGFGLGEVAH